MQLTPVFYTKFISVYGMFDFKSLRQARLHVINFLLFLSEVFSFCNISTSRKITLLAVVFYCVEIDLTEIHLTMFCFVYPYYNFRVTLANG